MNENILALVKAGFSAEEIKIIAPEAFLSSASDPPSVLSNGQPAAEPAVPAEPMEPAPAEPAPEQPAQEPAPAWFADYERQHNEQIAQLQRALQVQNVRRADEPAANPKTQEDLMREAFLAITN